MNITVKVVGIRRLLGHEEEHKIGGINSIGFDWKFLLLFRGKEGQRNIL